MARTTTLEIQQDLKYPMVVIVGSWNPAVFHPGWIAQHLFKVPSGEEVTLSIVADSQNKQIYFYQDCAEDNC